MNPELYTKEYATVTDGDSNWQALKFPAGQVYQWEPDSTYIRQAPYFDGMTATPAPVEDIHAARVLAVLGDSVTTDHISPAGSIKLNGPAGKYLTEHGVKPADFNSYGSRRGNHEVMVRGTFANVRLQEQARSRHRGRSHAAAARGRGHEHLRRQREVCRARRAAGDPRREGIRLGLVARLGGQGAKALRSARRHRRELRAHPPVESGGHGNSAAAILWTANRRQASG